MHGKLTNNLIEKLSISLVREYLVRRDLPETVQTLCRETRDWDVAQKSPTSRRALAEDLGLMTWMRLNKETQTPLLSMLEVLVKSFLLELKLLGHTPPKAQPNKRKPSKTKKTLSPNTRENKDDLPIKDPPALPSGRQEFCIEEFKKSIKDFYKDHLNKQSRIIGSLHSRPSEDHEEEPVEPPVKDPPTPDKGPKVSFGPDLRRHSPSAQRNLFTKSGSRQSKDSFDGGQSVPSNLTLGQNLLESKQNLLASVSLSPEEDSIRQAGQPRLLDLESMAADPIPKSDPNRLVTPNQFQDRRPKARQSTVQAMEAGTWRDLKALVLGPRGILQEGWLGQGFTFNQKIPFGLVQKKGGPCGVLSVVQALLLRNLMFGSAYCPPEHGLPVPETIVSPSATGGVTLRRALALAGALTEILWRSGGGEAEAGSAEAMAIVCLNGTGSLALGPGSEKRVFYDLGDLRTYVQINLHRFDCISLVYSAVLSRGLQKVQDDMDFPNSPLLGQHGYCTQELMNLLTVGKAISNAFDNQFVLGDKVLEGLRAQADIGLLSLFEHYDSCRVGSFLKDPKYPLWIVCSESHFSVLFSSDLSLATRPNLVPSKFDLFYYDGLSRQEKIIHLTVESSPVDTSPVRPPAPLNGNNNIPKVDDDDLVPPLEKCIRTKWKGVTISWNETEPIL